jgi:hypothetical protein
MGKLKVSKADFEYIKEELWLKPRREKTDCPNILILNKHILKNIDSIMEQYYEIDHSIIEEENPYENLLKELRDILSN